ncbi:MAG: class I SAM-dependent methyltransferase [Candidatus Norongarragalinales archaeon]
MPDFDQQEIWEKEHSKPLVLPQMSKEDASGGVVEFYSWLARNSLTSELSGVEMGCGKGRNCLWLAKQGVKMTGFDFSKNAISEARKKAGKTGLQNAFFLVHDATKKWPFDNEAFDIGIDCFASTDIDSLEGRTFARDEFKRVIKKSGFLLVYTLSTDDEFHKQMVEEYPAGERNSFRHPQTGKFEKIFDRNEIFDFYRNFKLIEECRIEKDEVFFGKSYRCKHFWLVFQK